MRLGREQPRLHYKNVTHSRARAPMRRYLCVCEKERERGRFYLADSSRALCARARHGRDSRVGGRPHIAVWKREGERDDDG